MIRAVRIVRGATLHSYKALRLLQLKKGMVIANCPGSTATTTSKLKLLLMKIKKLKLCLDRSLNSKTMEML